MLTENTLYADAARRAEIVKDKTLAMDALIFNFFGFMGLYKLSDKRGYMKTYGSTEKKLQVQSIGDDNHDVSLSVKLAYEAGVIPQATVMQMTKLLFLIKSKRVKGADLDSAKLREFLVRIRPLSNRPSQRVLSRLKLFMEEKIDIEHLARDLYKLARLPEYKPLTKEFRELVMKGQYTEFFSKMPNVSDDGDPVPALAPTGAPSTRPVVKQHDNMNGQCEKCKKGKYIETSIYSDLEGWLECSNCSHRVDRYVPVAAVADATKSPPTTPAAKKPTAKTNVAKPAAKPVVYPGFTPEGIMDLVLGSYTLPNARKKLHEMIGKNVLDKDDVERLIGLIEKDASFRAAVKTIATNKADNFKLSFNGRHANAILYRLVIEARDVNAAHPWRILKELYTLIAQVQAEKHATSIDSYIEWAKKQDSNASGQSQISFYLEFMSDNAAEKLADEICAEIRAALDAGRETTLRDDVYYLIIANRGPGKLSIRQRVVDFIKRLHDAEKLQLSYSYGTLETRYNIKSYIGPGFEELRKITNQLTSPLDSISRILKPEFENDPIVSAVYEKLKKLNPNIFIETDIDKIEDIHDRIKTAISLEEYEKLPMAPKEVYHEIHRTRYNIDFTPAKIIEANPPSGIAKAPWFIEDVLWRSNGILDKVSPSAAERWARDTKDVFESLPNRQYSVPPIDDGGNPSPISYLIEWLFDRVVGNRNALTPNYHTVIKIWAEGLEAPPGGYKLHERAQKGFAMSLGETLQILLSANSPIEFSKTGLPLDDAIIFALGADMDNPLHTRLNARSVAEFIKNVHPDYAKAIQEHVAAASANAKEKIYNDGDFSRFSALTSEDLNEVIDHFIENRSSMKYYSSFVHALMDLFRLGGDYEVNLELKKKMALVITDPNNLVEGQWNPVIFESILENRLLPNEKLNELLEFCINTPGAYPLNVIIALLDADIDLELDPAVCVMFAKNFRSIYTSFRSSSSVKEWAMTNMVKKTLVRVMCELIATEVERGNMDTAQEMFGALESDVRSEITTYMSTIRFCMKANELLKASPIKPYEDLSAARLPKILQYNNIQVPERPDLRRVKDLKSIMDAVDATKFPFHEQYVTPAQVDREGLDRMSVEYDVFNKRRHGNRALKFLRVFDVNIPAQKELFEEYVSRFEDTGDNLEIMSPVFHGTGSIAASFILRYGFAVIDPKDPAAVGRMLGNGIYFSNVLDKVGQYVSDTGYTRGIGTRGYVFEMKAALGEGDFKFAELGLVSPEWCVFKPNEQLLIYKAFEVEVIPGYVMDQMKERYLKEEEEGGMIRIKMFREFLREALEEGQGVQTFTFMSEYIPLPDGTLVDFEDFPASKFKGVTVEPSAYGPMVVIRRRGIEDAAYVIHDPVAMKASQLEQFAKALLGND